MDTTVIGIAEVVVAELRVAGYMESTIGQYGKSVKALTRFVEDSGGVYTPLLGEAFATLTTSPRTGRFSAQRRIDYGRLVSVFDTYVYTGRVELAVRKRGGGGAQPDSRPPDIGGRVVVGRGGVSFFGGLGGLRVGVFVGDGGVELGWW